MTHVTRTYPVDWMVVMRCALFALAEKDATILMYRETQKMIKAQFKQEGWFSHDEELNISLSEMSAISGFTILTISGEEVTTTSLLNRISTFIVFGSDLLEQVAVIIFDQERELEKAHREKQQRGFLGFPKKQAGVEMQRQVLFDEFAVSSGSLPWIQVMEFNGAAVCWEVFFDRMNLNYPVTPGFIIHGPDKSNINFAIDKELFPDRRNYLQICSRCKAVLVTGSDYCPGCSYPVSPKRFEELVNETLAPAANESLTSALLGFLFTLLPALVLIVLAILAVRHTAAIAVASTVGEFVPPLVTRILNLLPSEFFTGATKIILILVVLLTGFFIGLPCALFGVHAISQSRVPLTFLTFKYVDQSIMNRANIGQTLGWLDLFMGGALIAVVLMFLVAIGGMG